MADVTENNRLCIIVIGDSVKTATVKQGRLFNKLIAVS